MTATPLDEWMEDDLSARAEAGQLRAAYEIDDLLAQLMDVLAAGRHAILVGDRGVGKTAAVHELVRRSHAGEEPRELAGRRVVQISFRVRLSTLTRPERVRSSMAELCSHLLETGCDVVPFFRDVDRAYALDLEPQLLSLALRMNRPILCEADRAGIANLIEYEPELLQYFDVIEVEEPDLKRTRRILTGWAEEETRRGGTPFAPEAVDEALHLSYRFLARYRLPRKAIDLLRQSSASARKSGTVSAADIRDRFCATSRAPRFLLDPEVPLDLDDLRQRFEARVLGQREATDAVVEMISVMKAGLSDPRRPFGVFLFVGPTGVGKTHLAQYLAEYLFGSRQRMVRFNMADYQKPTDADLLFGDPDGDRAPRRRGQLTTRLAGHPFAVVLLDELEKAHPLVHDRFLQLADEGEFLNGAGEVVPGRSWVIVATSNEGAELYRGESLGFTDASNLARIDREVDRLLERRFRFEFLNRFDRVVHFHPLDRSHIRTVALWELEQIQERAGLKRRRLEIEIDESVLDWITAHGYDPSFGARHLRRVIERHAATPIAETLVGSEPKPGSRLGLVVRGGRIRARLFARKPAAREPVVVLPEGTGRRSRRLDRAALEAERERLEKTAAERLAELDERRHERADLLQKMGSDGFWDDARRARSVLERFRELDVAVRIEERLAERISGLGQAAGSENDPEHQLRGFARRLESAARALQEWEERSAEQGAASVWLVLSQLDPLHPVGDWIEELATLERRWCRHLGLEVEVAACELVSGSPARLVLDVEGPGAAAYLQMEVGVHRRYRGERRDNRVDVWIVERSAKAGSESAVSPCRRRQGPFGLALAWRTQIGDELRGLSWELMAADRAALAALRHDLLQHLDSPERDREVARLYGFDGAGARDPRTGAGIPKLREVLRGHLDPLLEAWRSRADRQASSEVH